MENYSLKSESVVNRVIFKGALFLGALSLALTGCTTASAIEGNNDSNNPEQIDTPDKQTVCVETGQVAQEFYVTNCSPVFIESVGNVCVDADDSYQGIGGGEWHIDKCLIASIE